MKCLEKNTDKEILIVGFNSRPIVSSAKELNYKTYVVDYFGDQDLLEISDHLFSILKQEAGTELKRKLYRPIFEYLLLLSETMAEEHSIEFILIGSGLDDYPHLWKRLGKIAPVLGNSPDTIEKVRDRIYLYDQARKIGIFTPQTALCKNINELIDFTEDIGYPIVIRSPKGAGGVNTYLVYSKEELDDKLNKIRGLGFENVLVQEYIPGIDASCSIIGNGESITIFGINRQLIGMRKLGMRGRFGYCGNITPLKISKKVFKRIEDVSIALGDHFGLIGSTGFDFVICNGEPFLMEVNPRFQGSLECIELVTNQNLVEQHINACLGHPIKKPVTKGYAVKMIVFSKKRAILPNLKLEGVFDVPFPHIIVNVGDPVCTVQVWNESRLAAIKNAWEKVSRIFQLY